MSANNKQNSFNEESIREYKARIQKVVDYIQNNISAKLTLDILAEVSCFSSFHFHRIFHAFTGETPNNFVNRIRIEKAANLLITYSSESITVIAFECGFISPAAFARAFKSHFGCSASQWRNGYAKKFIDSKNSKENSKIRKEDSRVNKYVGYENNLTFINGNKPGATSSREFKAGSENLNMNSEIKLMPAFHVAYIAHLEGYNDKIGKLFDRLCYWAGPRGLLTKETKFIGISFDNPKITPPEKCRYYACITVPENTNAEKEIGITNIPACKCAVVHFEGKQEEISTAYDSIFGEYIPQSGYLPEDRPAYEIYYADPQKDPERKFIMDLCVPVKPM